MTSKSSAASLTGKPLKDLTVVQLKNLCRERGIKGFVHKPKAKLLEMIEAASGTSAESAADTSSPSKPGKSRPTPKPEAKTSQGSGQQEDLASLTIAQLKQFCKDQGIKGFARKNKQQLIGLINSAAPSKLSNNQPGADEKKRKDPNHLDAESSLMDESDSDQLYSEDLDANQQGDPEESAEELSSAEIDDTKDNSENRFDTDAEETMVEVSDSLILEVLDRFDRIEALLQRIAENVDNP